MRAVLAVIVIVCEIGIEGDECLLIACLIECVCVYAWLRVCDQGGCVCVLFPHTR